MIKSYQGGNCIHLLMPYDAYGQLIRENNDILNKTILYTYDNIGNITAAQTYNYTLNDVSGAPTEEDTYTYSASYPDRLTIFNGKGITYDALGCVKTYDGWTYTWNKGKLSAMRKGPANSAAIAPSEAYTFAYNALGQRIEKKYTFSANASQTIDYLASCTSTYEYDLSGRLIREKRVSKYSDGVTITRVFSYLYEGSEIVGLIYNNGSTAAPYYYDKNPSGDVVAILDSTGTAVVKYKYDAFGNCSWLESTNNDLAQSNPIRYRSYCYDEDTGLYYLNARYYNPQWRRFISPAGASSLNPDSVNGLNAYVYCSNNPVGVAYIGALAGRNSGGLVSSVANSVYGGSWGGYSNSFNIFAGLGLPQLFSSESLISFSKDFSISISEVLGRVIWGLTNNGRAFSDFHYVSDGINGYTLLDNLPSTSAKIFKGIGVGLMALDVLEAGYYSYQNGHSFGQGALNVGLNAGKNFLVYKVSTGVTTAVGTWAGAKLGASLGSSAGPVGLVIGAIAGTGIGWLIDSFGDEIIEWIVGWFD